MAMRDYEGLVRCLRDCNDASETDICDCDKCLFKDRIVEHDGWTDYSECETAMCLAAADAIEELKQNIEQYKLYLQDAINDLRSAHEKEPKWISVEERLPDVNERVVACVSIHGEPSVWDAVRWNGKEWEAEEEVVYEYWTSIDFPVTHWMPMPEPPKEDGNG